MADLVLGLAKTVVNGTVIMAKSAIEEEEKLKKSVQRDLMLISDEFEMMHSFLSVANDNVPDDMATTSVRQVREMALDVEDCIESIIHLEDKSTWWRSMLPSCIPAHMPAAALHSAIADIELLKTRLEAMVQRNARYRHIGDSTTKPVEKMPQQAMSNSASASTIDDEARDLIELINNEDDKLQVISVFGNVGTMSVIKEAYTNQEICQKFRCRAWVRFMHPFNPQEFMRSLVAQFCGHESTVNPSEEMMAAAEGVHVRDFMKLMSHRNYLVILEDVSTMDDWEAARVYLPDKKNGSCIIVNTQQMEMATLCVGHPYRVAELEKYSADHSVFAFYKEVCSSVWTSVF
ncbi:hypothetical protein QOZ80_5AG0395500 [Eleusine coracana subsp. coracana]|nr:hypothetical protein QOZ80_5AG0395500 [Eleusine coracana subsp. coracana]